MESRIDGTLIRKGQCLLVEIAKSKDLYLPFWPPGTTYESHGKEIVIVSGGANVARVGGEISLGGGLPGSARPESLSDEAGGCPGKYWLVSVVN